MRNVQAQKLKVILTMDDGTAVAIPCTHHECARWAQVEEDFIKANPEWVKELELMLQTKEKAEIQALSSFGFQYLSQVYLPLKLQEADWI
jgi:meiotic recombination protein SPO11